MQSWDTRNLYNLYQRTFPSTPKRAAITFQTSTETLFKQRWVSKAACRAYHGDIIPEKIFKRWYLPATLPDVRPKRVSANTSAAKAELEAYAKRKVKEKDYQQAEQTKGLAPVLSLMFGEVERRVDTIIFRSCFAGSVYEARRMVVHGYVKLNGQKVSMSLHACPYPDHFALAHKPKHTFGARRHAYCSPTRDTISTTATGWQEQC